MRTFGHRSIASIINFVVSLTSLAAACGAVFAFCVLLAVPFITVPLSVTVPVSFTMDTPDQILGGRSGYGFEFRNTRSQPARSNRINRIEGSLRFPQSDRWFIAVNGVAL